jgi:Ni/Co efflux regulator RcnB
MRKVLSLLIAAAFAGMTVNSIAADKADAKKAEKADKKTEKKADKKPGKGAEKKQDGKK